MSRLLQYCCAVIVVIVALLHSADAVTATERNEIIRFHNKFRVKHHAPRVTYNKDLEKYAQAVSDTCKMEHSHGSYGENLAMGYKTPGDAITAWYNENKDYDYKNPGFSGDTGHFTQLIWKGTKQVGCGITICNDFYEGAKMIACSYKDAGNIVGSDNLYFKKNVLPP